jgi:hypothetical protein
MVEREPGAPTSSWPSSIRRCASVAASASAVARRWPSPWASGRPSRCGSRPWPGPAQQAGQPVRVVFTCERHAQQAARRYLDPTDARYFGNGGGQPAAVEGMYVEVIPLPCIGMAHPDLARAALRAGAAEVQFTGCPPEDCANREGNLWLQERVERKRLPRLRRELAPDPSRGQAGAPVSTGWLSAQRLSAEPARRRALPGHHLHPGLGHSSTGAHGAGAGAAGGGDGAVDPVDHDPLPAAGSGTRQGWRSAWSTAAATRWCRPARL